MSVVNTIWDGISNAFLMAWTVWWALVLGFAISAIVQESSRWPCSRRCSG